MTLRRTCFLIATCLLSFYSVAKADSTTLYLLNGTVLRGEIVDRSPKSLQLKTASGIVKVRTSTLMPISRQQLKLPAEVDKEVASSSEMEAVIAQMEKILAENESLKMQIETLKSQLAQSVIPAAEPPSPAEGPKD